MGLWNHIISMRYNNRRNTSNMSTFWKEVRKEKDIYEISINKKIGNGNKTLFWKERWFFIVIYKHGILYFMN
jgi:hypothetical protein